jgi:hypothetical protein
MTILLGVGIFLIVIGIGEYVVFRVLARREESIARRMTLLTVNSIFNVVVGIVLIALSR